MNWPANKVRQTFIDFFAKQHAHSFVPSSPVIPHEDPTLLFTNAGMNQFKPIFLGQADPGSDMGRLKAAVNSQKCIRAGGKHNDLEDVGKDTYHHTFFEMLGNWSFGDYFKEEAITWAWDLLTKVYGIPADRLYATYFGGNEKAGLAPDTEAQAIWRRFLPDNHIIPGNMKDNFWEMGDTGPCGPCSEIHYDRIGGRDASAIVNQSDPDVLEIWNNVFIQFERLDNGTLRTLPAKHVDTGMGLERLVSVLQNVRSNYDTDVFAGIFAGIERLTGARPYRGRLADADEGNVDTAYRVIADHIRTLTFALTDGAVPSNIGRGYVLRRILRRAARYGRQMLNAKTGFFSQLVPVVVDAMGDMFPELRKNPQRVMDIIREEEESFGRTLDRGIKLFEEAAARAGAAFVAERTRENLLDARTFADREMKRIGADGDIGRVNWSTFAGFAKPHISGDDAFKLYDTFGFPIDLTQLMAQECGMSVDTPGYERLMGEAKERSRAGDKDAGEKQLALDGDAVAKLRALHVPATDDAPKYDDKPLRAHVKAIWSGEHFEESSRTVVLKKRVGIVLDRTSFYAEMGGQVADTGRIEVSAEARSSIRDKSNGGDFAVEHTAIFGGYVLHIGHVAHGELRVGDTVVLHIDKARRQHIAANHTATHLANLGLRNVLGGAVDQKGSLVAPDRMRFDFSHNQPVSPDELRKVEDVVHAAIGADLQVYAETTPLPHARTVNTVRAVFGEAYPDPVRVVSIGRPVAELIKSPTNPEWMNVSVEFCGGTHVPSTSHITAFAIVSEEAVAKGVRRIVGVSGEAAQTAISGAAVIAKHLDNIAAMPDQELGRELVNAAAMIDTATLQVWRKAELRAQMGILQERAKQAAKHASAAKRDDAVRLARTLAESAATANEMVIIGIVDAGDDRTALQAALKVVTDKCPRAAVMLFSVDSDQGKVTIIAAVPAACVQKGLKAGDWVREAAAIVGGKGGGKPDNAQGGGTDVAKVKESIAAARGMAHKLLL
jgi:alanyl-tRNA synthetase